MIRVVFIIGILLSVAGILNAGWIITEQTTIEGSDVYHEGKLIIQDNMIKSAENDRVLIFDLNRWMFTVINPENETWWTGSPAEYLTNVRMVALDYLETEIAGADEYERPFLESLYRDIEKDMEQSGDVVTFMGELPLEIILTNATGRLLGYHVSLFNVYLDNKIVEEIWFTSDISINDEYDYAKFRDFIDEISWGGMFQDYRSSERYVHLMKSGLPLKMTERGDDGTTAITSVVSVERTSLPQSEFQPPRGFRQSSLSLLGLDLLY